MKLPHFFCLSDPHKVTFLMFLNFVILNFNDFFFIHVKVGPCQENLRALILLQIISDLYIKDPPDPPLSATEDQQSSGGFRLMVGH